MKNYGQSVKINRNPNRFHIRNHPIGFEPLMAQDQAKPICHWT